MLRSILRELIKRKSENPPCQCREILAYVHAFLKKHTHARVVHQRVTPGKGNIMAIFGKPRIFINAHLDTVPITGIWRSDPFVLRHVQGRLYGRGATDVKGAVAAILAAVREQQPRDAMLLFDSDEESGGGDCVQAFLKSPYRRGLRSGIVTEPTDLNIVTMHKGIRVFQVTFFGKAAHGAVPEKGANAIVMAAHFIRELEKYARSLRRRSYRDLSHATVTVGTIHGGVKFNIVPDRVVVEVDRRVLPGMDERSAEKEMKRLTKKYGRRAELATLYTVPSLRVHSKLPVIKLLRKCGARQKATGVDFWTEAALFTRAGMPSVVCGPGKIDQAHISNEFVMEKDLQRAKKVYIELFSLL